MSYNTRVGDPVEELKSTRLWQRLNNINSERALRACNFVEKIHPYLSNIHKHFPLYTRHDCHHSYEVVVRMGEIIIENLLKDTKDCLSDDEIFCLIVSAYAHDVGMVLYENEEKKNELFKEMGFPSDISPDDERLTSFLRHNHAERGIEFLRDNEAGSFVPEYLKGLIWNIMKGHNMHPYELFKELPSTAAIGRTVSNPISLSIVLCCADALEFSDTRVIFSAYEDAKRRNDEVAQISLLEMMKHRSIGCGISISKEGFIYATGEFQTANVLHATHKTLDQIEAWLKEYINYDKRQSRPLLKLHNPIIIRESFTTNNFKYHPVAIKMDEFQIREILTSKKMWGGSDSLPIKELIQNSLDACRYKQHVKPNSAIYNPEIKIVINNKQKSISVIDNGIGMTEDDVTNYFLQVGKSKSRTVNFIENPINKGFYSLARYGIGFWSVFSIAKKAIINTKYNDFYKTENGISFDVTVNPLMSYLELKPSTIVEGTKIELILKDEIDTSKIVSELINTITVARIPCSIVNESDQVLYKFQSNLQAITLDDIFGYKSSFVQSKGMKIFSYYDNNDIFELTLGIAYSEVNGKPRCLTPEGNSIFNYMADGKSIGESLRTSICGLTTSFNLGDIPFAIVRVGNMIIDIKQPEGLEFSLSRRSLEQNEKLEEILEKVRASIKTALEQFYTSIEVFGNAKGMLDIIDDSKSNGGEAGDTWIPGLYSYYLKNFKNLVPIKLLHWKKEANTASIDEQCMFIEDFWNIRLNVYYSCIWPDRFDNLRKINFLNAIINSVDDNEGYVMLAYQQAIALVEVATSAKIINLKLPYNDWKQQRSEVIVIEPWKGFEYKNRGLFEIQSRWSGKLISMDFCGQAGSKPWYNFGRYIMYVDPNHKLIKYLINLITEGKVWDCGDILALMSENHDESIKEVEKKTSIKATY
jgi:hypothetical protein